MPVMTDGSDAMQSPELVTTREPAKEKSKVPTGTDAFDKAVIIVVAAWILLLFFSYSLRHHNV